jgi:hypothetical protein
MTCQACTGSGIEYVPFFYFFCLRLRCIHCGGSRSLYSPKLLYTADVEAPADVAKPVDTLFDVEKAFAEMGIPSAVSGMRYMKGGGSY